MNKSNTINKSETDWARIDAMKDEDIDFSDNLKVTPEMFARGIRRNEKETEVFNGQETLAIDRDVTEFFKVQERDYQTKINQLLRAYTEDHQAK